MKQQVAEQSTGHPLLVTVAVAADRLGVTPFEALTLAEDGRVASHVVGSRRYISAASLTEFADVTR